MLSLVDKLYYIMRLACYSLIRTYTMCLGHTWQ